MDATRLDHPALFYSGVDDFLGSMAPYVAAGVEDHDFVFIAARGDNLSALRDEMGDRSDAVQWADTEEWHPHPGTRLRAFHDMASKAVEGGRRRLRLAGEPVWPSGPPELIREWQRYESVLNYTLEPFPATLVCLYDATHLDGPILDAARRNHPTLQLNGSTAISDEFLAPQVLLPLWTARLSAPPPFATRAVTAEPSAARRFVGERARQAGVAPGRVMDLCVAANEIVTNGLVHGSGVSDISVWTEGTRFLCQIEDRGPGIPDPLTGYRPPASDSNGGRGLWIARQLVDLIEIDSSSSGTTVRLHVRRS